jgi:hypothetical protein
MIDNHSAVFLNRNRHKSIKRQNDKQINQNTAEHMHKNMRAFLYSNKDSSIMARVYFRTWQFVSKRAISAHSKTSLTYPDTADPTDSYCESLPGRVATGSGGT